MGTREAAKWTPFLAGAATKDLPGPHPGQVLKELVSGKGLKGPLRSSWAQWPQPQPQSFCMAFYPTIGSWCDGSLQASQAAKRESSSETPFSGPKGAQGNIRDP